MCSMTTQTNGGTTPIFTRYRRTVLLTWMRYIRTTADTTIARTSCATLCPQKSASSLVVKLITALYYEIQLKVLNVQNFVYYWVCSSFTGMCEQRMNLIHSLVKSIHNCSPRILFIEKLGNRKARCTSQRSLCKGCNRSITFIFNFLGRVLTRIRKADHEGCTYD